MMSLTLIDSMSRKAATRAAKAKKIPFMVWPEDLKLWNAVLKTGRYPQIPFPNIGSYNPPGYEKTEEYFVDSSGFGEPGEPALTIPEFVGKIKSGFAYAITEAGQFQVYITEYRKEKDAEKKRTRTTQRVVTAA